MLISIYFFLFIELLVVSYFDLKYKIIKNEWAILNLVITLVMYIFFQDYRWMDFFENGMIPIICLFLGMIFFYVKIMGAGDSKYLFSFLFMHTKDIQSEIVFSILIAMMIIGIIIYVLKLFYFPLPNKIPFAPIILLGWLIWGFFNLGLNQPIPLYEGQI